MTVSEAIKSTGEAIEKVTPTPDFEAKQLVAKAINTDSTKLALSFDKNLTAGEQRHLTEYVLRRKHSYPLQYIIGMWEFYSLPMYVGRGVLIPRQDTETVVDVALKFAKDTKNPVIFDLCSGTGAIAIALKKNIPDATVYAVENSRRAAKYLKKNIKLNHSGVMPMINDAVTWLPKVDKKADIITSNPPYIPEDDMNNLPKDVKFEPKEALDGGEDGLQFYHIFIRRGRHLLKENGKLIFEVGDDQAEYVKDIMMVAGYKNVEIYKDLNGIDRVVCGTYKHYKYLKENAEYEDIKE